MYVQGRVKDSLVIAIALTAMSQMAHKTFARAQRQYLIRYKAPLSVRHPSSLHVSPFIAFRHLSLLSTYKTPFVRPEFVPSVRLATLMALL